ncbi:MAG TPA: NlpC/P60 family protein [Microthrixaceae bacterium]|jgi:cell wall-associated NlpC family hydrolase|nr:NlpC/P60 family protein [Microthrixaceae bacterium]HQF94085.1 NlpC/P60 family protein [Microthrixaceae bacterium]
MSSFSPQKALSVRRPAGLAVRGAAITLFVTLLPGVAGAQPVDRQQSIGTLQEQARKLAAELDQLDQKTNDLDEQYNDARLQLDGLRQKLADNQAQVDAARAQLDTNRADAQRYAIEAFVGNSDDSGLVGIADDAIEESQRRTYLASRYGDSEQVVEGLVAAQKDLADQEADLSAANDKVEAKQAEIENAKTQLEATIKNRRDLAAGVQGQLEEALKAEQARLAAEAEAKAKAEAEAAAKRAAAARRVPAVAVQAAAPGSSGSAARAMTVVASSPPAAASTTPVPAGAPTAVEVALAQQGDPYRWAASGPDSFDCSGLIMFAYKAAGVSLPHSSRALRGMTERISVDELQPGDLVFGGSPVHHVGMYIGNGQMVHAPHSGDVVRVASVYSTSKPVSFGRL